MPTVIDALTVELGLDAAKFNRGQRDATQAFKKTREGVEKDAKGIEGAVQHAADRIDVLARNALRLFAVFTAGKSLGQFAADVSRTDAAVGRLATSLGQAPAEISAVAKAVERAGGSADGAAASFDRWTDHVEQLRLNGTSPLLQDLSKLEAAGGRQIDYTKSVSKQFEVLSDNLKAVADKYDVAAATQMGKNLGFDPGLIALMVKGSAAYRDAVAQSQKFGVTTRADAEAAQKLQTALAEVRQTLESLGRTIMTAVSPFLVRVLKDFQWFVGAIRDFIALNIAPHFKSFAEAMGESGSSIKELVVATEALIVLYTGAKFLALLRVLGTLRMLLLGGRVAAPAAAAGGSLLGGILGLGAAATAASSQNILTGPQGSRSWHEGLVRSLDPGIADRIYGPSRGEGGPTLMGRATGWVRRQFGLGGGGAATGGPTATGGGPVSARPITPGAGEGHVASREERANYIRQAAIRNGIDPEVALRVAQSEGFDKYTGDQGRSFGDWQLFTGGGLGNEAEKAGIDVRDPNTWKEQTDFALRKAREGGWGPWKGAAKEGIGEWQGIGRRGRQPAEVAPSARTGGVDPRLIDIIENAKTSLPEGYTAKIISGLRPGDRRFHGQGLASDVAIYDPQGRKLGNYQNASTFREYEKLAQAARRYQMQKYPELAKAFRWGGYFGGPAGKYGALDTMHFDLGGHRTGMGGGSWSGGLTPAQRQLFPGANSQGMGQDARSGPQSWWRGSPDTRAYAAHVSRGQQSVMASMTDNRQTDASTTNSTVINGGVQVQTSATDASGIARDMHDAIQKRSFASRAQSGPA